ncbi:MAG: membrane protein insertase YidC [Pseudomonadota bacterium]
MENNRNLFLTIGLSVLILALWQVFFINPRIEAEREAQLQREAQQQVQQVEGGTAATGAGDLPTPTVGASTDGSVPAPTGGATLARDAALAETQRIRVETPTLSGTLNLTGARFDDLTLKDYREEVDPTSDNVVLLSPVSTERAYFAEFGYAGLDGAPGPSTQWTITSGSDLTPSSPVVLSYEAPSGLVFDRQIGVDENYMFTITAPPPLLVIVSVIVNM